MRPPIPHLAAGAAPVLTVNAMPGSADAAASRTAAPHRGAVASTPAPGVSAGPGMALNLRRRDHAGPSTVGASRARRGSGRGVDVAASADVSPSREPAPPSP